MKTNLESKLQLKIAQLPYLDALALINLGKFTESEQKRRDMVDKDFPRTRMIGDSENTRRDDFEALWDYSSKNNVPNEDDDYEVVTTPTTIPPDHLVSNDYVQGTIDASTFDFFLSNSVNQDDITDVTEYAQRKILAFGYIDENGKPCGCYIGFAPPKRFCMAIVRDTTNLAKKKQATIILNQDYQLPNDKNNTFKPLEDKKAILEVIGSEKIALLISKLIEFEKEEFSVNPAITDLIASLDTSTNNEKQVNAFIKKQNLKRMDTQDMIYAILQSASEHGFVSGEHGVLKIKKVITNEDKKSETIEKYHPYHLLNNKDKNQRIAVMFPLTDLPNNYGPNAMRASLSEAQPMIQKLCRNDPNLIWLVPISEIKRGHWVFVIFTRDEMKFFDPKSKTVPPFVLSLISSGLRIDTYNNDFIKEAVETFLSYKQANSNPSSFFNNKDKDHKNYYSEHVKVKGHPQDSLDWDSCGFFVAALAEHIIKNNDSKNNLSSLIEQFLATYEKDKAFNLVAMKEHIATRIGYGKVQFPAASLQLYNHQRKEVWENPDMFKETAHGKILTSTKDNADPSLTSWSCYQSPKKPEDLLNLITSIEKKELEDLKNDCKTHEVTF